jgi:N-acetylmuramic acid 6-phosphate etherase
MTNNPDHPPDRAHVRTEHRNPRSMSLDTLSVRECAQIINTEDHLVAPAVKAALPELTALIEDIEPRFLAGGRLIYIGAGTSGRLGVLDASECPPTFQTDPSRVIGIIAGGDAALRTSSEGMEDDPQGCAPELTKLHLTPNDTLIGIAAGGTTPYVLGAIEIAIRAGARTAFITCTPPTNSSSSAAHHTIFLDTGPELLTGSTRMKAATATKLALNTITTALMIRAGKAYENLMVDLRASNDKLRDRAARIISSLTDLDRPAALALLDRADNSVKHAVLMHLRSLNFNQADARLTAANANLRAALDP